MASNHRTRSAILAGAKKVIAIVGSYESNMNDIAEKAQVARATVYNHFSDKEEMMLTLVESEITRLAHIAQKASTVEEKLFLLSSEISSDPALRKMVDTDPLDIAKFVTVSDHRLWVLAQNFLSDIFGSAHCDLVLHWLIGQIASPLSKEQSRLQAALLVKALS